VFTTLLIAAALATEPTPAFASNPDASSSPDDAEAPVSVSEQNAGTLRIDIKLPAEVLLDGVKLAETYVPAQLSFEVVAGPHLLRVYTHGDPHDLPIEVEAGDALSVVVGRTGMSGDRTTGTAPDPNGIVPVEFRVLDGMASTIRIDGGKHTIPQGDRLTLDLPVGTHPVSVRSADGTIIWATGRLTLGGHEGVVVQVAEGRLPEVSGDARFDPSGG